MDVGIKGKMYSITAINELNRIKPLFYTGELLDEDPNFIKIKDKFGDIIVLDKSRILKMKQLTGSDY